MGKKPRRGHNQDLEGAKPKLDQAWDPQWMQTVTAFGPESGMGGKNQTGSWLESRTGENPDWIRAGI